MDHERNDEKLLVGEPGALPTYVGRPQQHRRTWCGIIRKIAKAAFLLVAAVLVVTICACAGYRSLVDIAPDWLGREGSIPNNIPGDCRSSGCRGGFTCAAVDAQVACFVGPCPSTLFECIPTAMVGMPDATEVSIMPVGAEITPEMAQPSPEADWPVPSYSKDQKITEEFYACIQQHGGQNAWINPADGCNTCICTLHGTIACTKKLCSPVHQAADAVSQAMNQASDVHTTVMVPLASASGDAESTFYTSVPIDIDA